jgi:hypothetical protein
MVDLMDIGSAVAKENMKVLKKVGEKVVLRVELKVD